MAGRQTELIKEKLDIVDFLRNYLVLQSAGKNFKALCPFHKEKTPSFMISRERQSWHCFGCFPKGSLVKTPIGFHAINDLKIGDTVISGKGREKRILFVHRHMYDGDLVRIKLRKLGGEVALTGDHKVFVIRGAPYTKSYKNFSRRFSKYNQLPPERYFRKIEKYFPIVQEYARDLSVGDLLLYPIGMETNDVRALNLHNYLKRQFRFGPIPKSLAAEVEIGEKFLKLLGYWIAEGSSHRAYIRFSLGPSELLFAQEIKRLIKEVFGLESGIHIRTGNKTGIEVTCCHAALADIFRNLCGNGAVNKHIPFDLRYLQVKKQMIFLDAIWRGDGTSIVRHRSSKTEYSIVTVSNILSEQLVDILLRMGIFPSVQVGRERTGVDGVHHRESYTVKWGTSGEDKYDLVYHTREGVRYWVLPIVSINQEPFLDEVYNLTIEDDHSYVARNFAVANCGLGGDIFAFLMRHENLEFGEALRMLAEKAGIEIGRLGQADYKYLDLLYGLNDLAKDFFERELENFEPAKSYLKERGLGEETIQEFELGFAPNSAETLNLHLLNLGYRPEDIVSAGLSLKTERGKQIDRFRGRLMFPIQNHMGKVVGFTGRILPQFDTGELGKYVNSPETPIFNKSRLLYGFSKTKNFIREEKAAFLVEGQMDMLMSWQAGIKNVVATSGTALTPDHLRTLKRFTDQIILSFDNDEAGFSAGERAIDLADTNDFQVKVAMFGDFKDPAEASLASPDYLKKSVAEAKPAMEFYFKRYLPGGPILKLTRSELKNLRTVLSKIKLISSPVEQNFWLKELSKRAGLEEKVLAEEAEKIEVKAGEATERGEIEERLPDEKFSRRDLISQHILSAALAKSDFNLVVGELEYFSPEYQILCKLLQAGSKAVEDPKFDHLLNIVMLRSSEESGKELAELKVELIKEYTKDRRRELTHLVKKAEAEGDEARLSSVLKELKQLDYLRP